MSSSFGTPWTVAHKAPQSMGFPRQEYWSRLPFLSPRDLPDPEIEPGSPALQADSLPLSHLEPFVPSFNKAGTHSLAHPNMCSAPTCGEAVSPAGPAGPCHTGLIQPLSTCHFWHPMEGIQLYSAVNSGKYPG